MIILLLLVSVLSIGRALAITVRALCDRKNYLALQTGIQILNIGLVKFLMF